MNLLFFNLLELLDLKYYLWSLLVLQIGAQSWQFGDSAAPENVSLITTIAQVNLHVMGQVVGEPLTSDGFDI